VLEGDVYNGGFDQYFHNSSADHYSRALETLVAVGASNTARLVVAAKEVLFGDARLPATTIGRRRHVLSLPSGELARRRTELERVDAGFCRDPDDLEAAMKAFALHHALQSDF
jgi:hypothetical protein